MPLSPILKINHKKMHKKITTNKKIRKARI